MVLPFAGFYSGKRVLVTGHTGFKGSWLALWLSELGAEVVGFSQDPPSSPNHFEACQLANRIRDVRGDILDFDRVSATIREHRPHVIFHLAAQALVRVAYQDPLHTFNVNVMGTANVLEAARQCDSVSQFIAITSDKVYRVHDSDRPFQEMDTLGGFEPYGASKACAELVVAAYQDRRFQDVTRTNHPFAVASVRAGNVIGGGDWGQYRIVPDLVRAIQSNRELVIRFPHATRPWQHVLDSLSGYLWLARRLASDPDRFSTAWNFGPTPERTLTVEELVRAFLKRWHVRESFLRLEPAAEGEQQNLRVDSHKAREQLEWQPAWNLEQTIQATIDWYRTFLESGGESMSDSSLGQIRKYTECARELGIAWAG